MRKFAGISITLKITQGVLAFISIAIQSHALTNRDFNTFSVIGNAIVMTSFLDLGIGVQFIQNHLLKMKKTNENEDREVLDQIRHQSTVFIKVALIQSTTVTAYAIIYGINLTLDSITLLSIVTLITTFVFSSGGIISRALTARGYVTESLWYQLIGVFFQFLFLMLAYNLNLSVEYYIGSLSIPNFVLMLLTLRKLSLNKSLDMRPITFVKVSFKATNMKVQVMQIVQFVASTVPLLLLSMKIPDQTFSIVLIYWRIFTSVAATTSSFNSQEWRDSALKNDKKIPPFSDLIYLMKKLAISCLLASLGAIGTYIFWNFLTDVPRQINHYFDILWVIFVVTQVYHWHFYFKLLALQDYLFLIKGGVLLFCSTIFILYLLSTSDLLIFPLSIIGGVVISGIYFQIRSSSRNILVRKNNA